MTHHDFIKLPIRLLTAQEEYQIKRADPFFVDFWRYPDFWPAINNRVHLEIGHDGKYRYIVPTRAAKMKQQLLATHKGGL